VRARGSPRTQQDLFERYDTCLPQPILLSRKLPAVSLASQSDMLFDLVCAAFQACNARHGIRITAPATVVDAAVAALRASVAI
jgi:hypothetical protein